MWEMGHGILKDVSGGFLFLMSFKKVVSIVVPKQVRKKKKNNGSMPFIKVLQVI